MTTTTPGHVLPVPSTPARPRRVSRRLAALAGGLALVVAVPVALSAPASAATPTTTTVASHAPTVVTKHSKTKVHLSKKTQTRGKAVAKVRVTVHVGRAVASGKVVLKVGSKTWKTVTLKHGTARVQVSRTLKAGKHRITAIYKGASHVARSKGSAVIKVKKGTPKVVTVAKKYVGTPYRSGASGPRAFDCSGFTSYVFKKAGVKSLPRTSSAQHHVGKTVSRKNAKPGDIIWSPGHVAIYLGGNKMIDAPRPGKTIQVRSIWQSHPTFIRVNAKAVSA
ncbi:C40 family peptidase [Cellulomonas sp. PhB150]|uniref:C40 family peptidase n=1 Tax=Cellulomonas sp. PhB150 TaxID=2485188 RepID=UPI000F486AD1|nr:C40 family peptidase [Cellulomonas sp. PhB150]ROS23947.1 Ig-like domain-containing protein [Cellulomonas sp. PhB150]